MFGGTLTALAHCSEEERRAWGQRIMDDLRRYPKDPAPRSEFIPDEDQCMNCYRRAMENGWCLECWAEVAG